jgi:hypothetical protein
MRKRLVALVVVAGALAFGPATAASASTPAQVPAQTSVAVTAVGFTPPGLGQLGRYWS